MSQLPGRKFKQEHHKVDGVAVPWDIRVDDSGTFYAIVNETEFKAATLADLRTQVHPILEARSRLVFAPFICVEYLKDEKTSRYDNRQDESQEVSLRFWAVWRSTSTVWVEHRWRNGDQFIEIRGSVGKDGLIKPLTDEQKRNDASPEWSDHSDRIFPFTVDRWRALEAVSAAIAETRRRLAVILGDVSGGHLDALTGAALLPPLPEYKPATGSKRRKREP